MIGIKSFDRNDYEPISIIGHGTYSEVALEKNKATGQLVAIKTFTLTSEDERYETDFMKEISILGTFDHPCIIGFHGFNSREENGNLILSYALDYMEKGCLDDLLRQISMGIQIPDFGPTEKSIIVLGVACAMQYLHYYSIKNGNVIHRDLKSGNILLDHDYKPKLADFGFAKVIFQDDFNTPKRGSWPWMAPEVMTSSKYGVKSDVYSFGMLLYEIATGYTPFVKYRTIAEIYEAVVDKHERPFLPDPQQPIYSLIKKCWADNPDERPTFIEIIPYLLTETFVFENTDLARYFNYAKSIRSYDPSLPE